MDDVQPQSGANPEPVSVDQSRLRPSSETSAPNQSARNNPSHVICAAISTDHGKERGYATTIWKDGTVKKTPLFPEGKENAIRL